jgi:hypothetical protein
MKITNSEGVGACRFVADLRQVFLTQRLSVAAIGTPRHSQNKIALSLFVRKYISSVDFFLSHDGRAQSF